MSALLVLVLSAGVDVSRLEALQAGYKYAEVARLAEVLRQRPGLSRAELLRLVEVQALAAGHLRQSAEAEGFFVEVLALEPGYVLGDEQPPRVSTPFLAARRRALEVPALALTMVPSFADGVTTLRFDVSGPAALAQGVRVHLKTEGGWETRRLAARSAVIEVPRASVEWWAEVLGARDAQTLVVGSATSPRAVTAPPPPPPLLTPTRNGPAPAEAFQQPLEPPAATWSPKRTLSVVTLGGAAVALGLGIGFGQASRQSFETVTRAARVNDVVVGVSLLEAQSMVARGRQEAWVANGLFLGAGVAALVAGLLWLVSS